ncbi:MAG TPA: thioesterase domain-containing protein, partial [Allocoleopsis sp.]
LDEQGQPVAIGQIGELYIGGEGVARGYLNRPDLTAAKFIPDPFSSQLVTPSQTAASSRSTPCLYRTGDLGRYLPDGTIEFLGRIDHQVKIRGFRVEMGEIEAVLFQHRAVRNCAILVREDAPGHQQLVAYLVGDRVALQLPSYRNPTALLEEIRSLLRKQLPDHMVPAAFVWLDQLPLTPNGKLDRKALPVPDYSSLLTSSSTPDSVMPQDPIEEQLVEIWQSYLNVAPISVTANFFDLGGNSLLAIPLWAKIEQTFQCNLPLITLFQMPTIAQLAERLRQPGAYPTCPSLVVMQSASDTSKLPLFCIHTLGRGLRFYRPLMQYLDPEQAIYGLSTQIAGEAFPSHRVEDLALHYVEQMRQIQPEGPYLLLGFSYGGLVAYEMARILERQGQAVAMLALVDSYWEGALQPSTVLQDVLQARQTSATFTHYVGQYLLPKLGRAIERGYWKVQELGWNTIRRLAIGVLQTLQQPLPPDLQDFVFIEENRISMQDYIPQPYAGNLILFKADQQLKKVDEHLGWQEFVRGQFELYEVPGSHLDLLVEPQVQTLGNMLQACITQALNRASLDQAN